MIHWIFINKKKNRCDYFFAAFSHGWLNACSGVILSEGSQVRHLLIKSAKSLSKASLFDLFKASVNVSEFGFLFFPFELIDFRGLSYISIEDESKKLSFFHYQKIAFSLCIYQDNAFWALLIVVWYMLAGQAHFRLETEADLCIVLLIYNPCSTYLSVTHTPYPIQPRVHDRICSECTNRLIKRWEH